MPAQGHGDDGGPLDAARKSLAKSGLPLELATARALKGPGSSVRHAVFYRGTTTDVMREIDVVAEFRHLRNSSTAAPLAIVLTLVVECKAGSDGPWLLLRDDSDWPSGLSAEMLVRLPHVRAGELQFSPTNFPRWADAPLLSPNDPTHAYQMLDGWPSKTPATGKKGGGKSFEAIMQVLSAAQALAEARDGNGRPGEELGANVFLPVIVTNHPLVWCSLDDDGEIQLDECNEPAMLVTAQSSDVEPRSVWIVPAPALSTFRRMAQASHQALRSGG